jgi:hypothetical protein
MFRVLRFVGKARGRHLGHVVEVGFGCKEGGAGARPQRPWHRIVAKSQVGQEVEEDVHAEGAEVPLADAT